MRERLEAIARRLDALALRMRTLGLVRAAEDLAQVSAELRWLGGDDVTRRASGLD